MVSCFCFRDVLEAFSAPLPLPARKESEHIPDTPRTAEKPVEDISDFNHLNHQTSEFLANELINAVHNGEIDKIEILIKIGADPAFRSHSGTTALATAASSGRQDIFAMLLRTAAGIHARNESRLDLHFSN